MVDITKFLIAVVSISLAIALGVISSLVVWVSASYIATLTNTLNVDVPAIVLSIFISILIIATIAGMVVDMMKGVTTKQTHLPN